MLKDPEWNYPHEIRQQNELPAETDIFQISFSEALYRIYPPAQKYSLDYLLQLYFPGYLRRLTYQGLLRVHFLLKCTYLHN